MEHGNLMEQEHPAPVEGADNIDPNPENLKHLPRVLGINGAMIAAAIVLAAFAFLTSTNLVDATTRSETAHQRYEECSDATTKLLIASDYLTTQSRMFVVTGDAQYMNNYLGELLTTKNRDKAVSVLNREIEDAKAASELTAALSESNDLAARELYAMRLTAEAVGVNPLPDALKAIVLEPQDVGLSAEDAQKQARQLMLDNGYRDMKAHVISDVNACTSALIEGIQQRETAIERDIDRLIFWLLVVVSLLVALIAFAALINYHLIIRPLRTHAVNLRNNEPLEPMGAYELQRAVRAYNTMYETNRQTTMQLKRKAETDALTELFNRGFYDKLLEKYDGDFVLILVDVDKFKLMNDKFGHQTGDAVLRRVAGAIAYHFQDTDYVCRIGGDEFAVIMTEKRPENRDSVARKIDAIAKTISEDTEDLPEVTLSFGAAFSTELEPGESIYHAADMALYSAKRNGRNKCVFYSDL
ncbi:MAG: GGDEF domain-containing protein [Coriobacteriaceae bacterium]|nr:GGDEF domain-containing protein [Coriobacteriaceae bacterium]